MARYYCRGAEGEAGHCDDRPHTIQCSFCIWYEQTKLRKQILDAIHVMDVFDGPEQVATPLNEINTYINPRRL